MNGRHDNPDREEILSREETDALLQGIDDGSIETDAATTTNGETILYDFSDCERLARGAMPALDVVNARIARRLRDALGELLRRHVDVEIERTIECRYGDHIPTLTLPASLNLVRLLPLPGTMLIVPDARLVYLAVDCFFGGRGKVPPASPAREFTQVENRMIALLLDKVFAALRRGWEQVVEIDPELIGQEQNPQFAAIAAGNEPVIVTLFSVSCGEETLQLQFITPRALLEPVEELLEAEPRSDADAEHRHFTAALRDRLQDSRIGLQSTLTRTTMRLGEMLSLQPGDVIPVDMPDQVVVEAAGTPLFSARIGVSRNHNAVEILAPTAPAKNRQTNPETQS